LPYTCTSTPSQIERPDKGNPPLIEEVVAEARHAEKKIVSLCSYAAKMMTSKEEYRDVL